MPPTSSALNRAGVAVLVAALFIVSAAGSRAPWIGSASTQESSAPRVPLEESEEVETPPPPPAPPPSPAAENPLGEILAFLISTWRSVNWYLVLLIALLIAELARPRTGQPAATATATRRTLAAGEPDDADLLAEALAVTDLNSFVDHLRQLEDRSKAVLLVYVYAALGHDGIPARNAQTTPHEWLSTVAAQNETTAAAATELVEQYVQVRFGDQLPTEEDRSAAIESLVATFARAKGHSVA